MKNLQIPNTGVLSGLSLVNDINLAITSLQNNKGGYLSKSVAGGSNVTLTTDEVDNGLIQFTGALTASIQVIVPAASFQWLFYNGTSGAYTLTVKTPSGTGIVIPQGKVVALWCDGTNVLGFNYLSDSGGTLSGALNDASQVTLASASTVNIGAAASNTISVSGTTTITAFDTIASGALRRVTFQGALTLTYNATSLILPGSANITTAAGDVAIFESLGSGNWRCINYAKANGAPLLLLGATLSDGTNSTSTTNCIQGSAKAWANFVGGSTPTINASYNVSSITFISTGAWTINFTNAFADSKYSIVGSASNNGASANFLMNSTGANKTTTSARVDAVSTGAANVNVNEVSVAIFR